MTNTKIDKLRAQREALDRKIKDLAAADNKAAREADKRRKIIIGGWVIKHRPQLVNEIIENGLYREQDKAAFEGWSLQDSEKILPESIPSSMAPVTSNLPVDQELKTES